MLAGRSFLDRLARWAGWLVPLLLLALMLAFNPTLRSGDTWDLIGRNWAGVALLAFAMTPIVLTGGIDLSVGSVVGLSAVMAGFLWKHLGLPVHLALVGGVLTGLLAGIINGALVVAGVSPLVLTLATLGVFRGLAISLSGQQRVDDFPDSMEQWWEGNVLMVPRPVWMILIAFTLVYVFVHHTWMGRMLFAMGDNVRAARYAGVPVRGLTFSLYAFSGLTAGVVGWASVCASRSAPPGLGEGLELQAVACVVLGGVRITGGAGHVAGTALGTLTLAALLEGLVSVPARWRLVFIGVFLIVVAMANEGLARWRARLYL